MTIEEPRINVALTTNDDRTSILIRRSDADAARPNEQMRWVSWQLAAIAPGATWPPATASAMPCGGCCMRRIRRFSNQTHY